MREGLSFVVGHAPLRRLVASNAVLSWAIVMLGPAELLLAVRELGATPVQFGLLLALPCLVGPPGPALAPRAVRALGTGLLATWLPLRALFVIGAVLLLLPVLLLDRVTVPAATPAVENP